VSTVDSPEEANALAGDPAPAELRGNIAFCNDCLAASSCEALLPG
jgi:hypothetical protein